MNLFNAQRSRRSYMSRFSCVVVNHRQVSSYWYRSLPSTATFLVYHRRSPAVAVHSLLVPAHATAAHAAGVRPREFGPVGRQVRRNSAPALAMAWRTRGEVKFRRRGAKAYGCASTRRFLCTPWALRAGYLQHDTLPIVQVLHQMRRCSDSLLVGRDRWVYWDVR